MKLTAEQIQYIIDDAVNKANSVIDSILDGDNFECYEDDYGRSYNHGSKSIYDEEVDEICYEGIPGIVAGENADVYISALMDGDIEFEDTYDSGDYWTPPSGGIEFTSYNFKLCDIDIQISVYDESTDEFISIEVSDEEKKYIIDEVNKQLDSY